jgi:chaperonin GroEL
VLEKVADNEGSYGYDASAGEYCDLLERGVIDPTKVVRTALENAVSVSSVLLSTDAVVGDTEEEDEDDGGGAPQQPPAPGM